MAQRAAGCKRNQAPPSGPRQSDPLPAGYSLAVSNTIDAGEVRTRFTGDRGDLKRTIKASMSDLDKFAARSKQVGKRLTRSLTLPIAGAGLTAVLTARKFETSMSQIESLVGRSRKEVQGLTKAVHGIAAETGRGPQELAKAMFFITSAGLDATTAVETLRASAKAAAVGLGDTASVVDAVTNAVNGYGKSVISPTKATDILVKAIEQGKVEAAELAPQFGRLVPIAAELGVGFDELAASLAYMSRSTGDASLATIGLKGVLSKIIKPAEQGKKQLAKIGWTIEDLRARIRDDLLGTLEELYGLGQSGKLDLSKLFMSEEALTGFLQLAKGGDEVRAVFDEIAGAAGKTEQAFEIAAKTAEVRMGKAMAKMKSQMVELGMDLLPAVADGFEMVGDVAGWVGDIWNSLDDGTKKVALGLAVLAAAAAGPAAWAIGTVVADGHRPSRLRWLRRDVAGAGPAGAWRIARWPPSRSALLAQTSRSTRLAEAETPGNERIEAYRDVASTPPRDDHVRLGSHRPAQDPGRRAFGVVRDTAVDDEMGIVDDVERIGDALLVQAAGRAGPAAHRTCSTGSPVRLQRGHGPAHGARSKLGCRDVRSFEASGSGLSNWSTGLRMMDRGFTDVAGSEIHEAQPASSVKY